MNFKKYKVITLPKFKEEFYKKFGYILKYQKKDTSFHKLLNSIILKLQQLEDMPKIHAKIEKSDELGRRYRKIIIKQYVILYTIDETKKQVYISDIFYKKSDYLNKI